MQNILFQHGPVKTERLVLKPLTKADAIDLVLITNDPLVAAGISFLRQPFRIADAEGLIEQQAQGTDCFAAARRQTDGAFVGVVGAHGRGLDIEIGYWLGASFHGHRYASEAARTMLKLIRDNYPTRPIIAECSPENKASWRLLEKLNFQDTGRRGQAKGRNVLQLKG